MSTSAYGPWRLNGGMDEPMHKFYDPRIFDVVGGLDLVSCERALRRACAPRIIDGAVVGADEVGEAIASQTGPRHDCVDVTHVEQFLSAGFDVTFLGPVEDALAAGAEHDEQVSAPFSAPCSRLRAGLHHLHFRLCSRLCSRVCSWLCSRLCSWLLSWLWSRIAFWLGLGSVLGVRDYALGSVLGSILGSIPGFLLSSVLCSSLGSDLGSVQRFYFSFLLGMSIEFDRSSMTIVNFDIYFFPMNSWRISASRRRRRKYRPQPAERLERAIGWIL